MGILPPIQIEYYTTSETTSQEPPDAPLDARLDARPSPSARIPALPPAPGPRTRVTLRCPLLLRVCPRATLSLSGTHTAPLDGARSGMRSPLRASLFYGTESLSPEGSVARGSASQSVLRGEGRASVNTRILWKTLSGARPLLFERACFVICGERRSHMMACFLVG